jgi:hypothetical protein
MPDLLDVADPSMTVTGPSSGGLLGGMGQEQSIEQVCV